VLMLKRLVGLVKNLFNHLSEKRREKRKF